MTSPELLQFPSRVANMEGKLPIVELLQPLILLVSEEQEREYTMM